MTIRMLFGAAVAAALMTGVSATARAQALDLSAASRLDLSAHPLFEASGDDQRPRQPPPAGQSSGPMTLEQSHNGIVIVPEFKFTKVNGSSARLAGAYGGWLIDDRLLLGGGGYFMTNRSRGFDMHYGGGVVEWRMPSTDMVSFSVRGLIGYGEATLTDTFNILNGAITPDMRDLDWMYPNHPMNTTATTSAATTTLRLAYREQFFIAEPQANLLVALNKRVKLQLGAGYRATATPDRISGRIRGATGSVGLEFDFAR